MFIGEGLGRAKGGRLGLEGAEIKVGMPCALALRLSGMRVVIDGRFRTFCAWVRGFCSE
jgi:hypothetical protein